jgi:hypothetical protein
MGGEHTCCLVYGFICPYKLKDNIFSVTNISEPGEPFYYCLYTNYNTSKLDECLKQMKYLENKHKQLILEFNKFAHKYNYIPDWHLALIGELEIDLDNYLNNNDSDDSDDDKDNDEEYEVNGITETYLLNNDISNNKKI